jgi:hypothetical protein
MKNTSLTLGLGISLLVAAILNFSPYALNSFPTGAPAGRSGGPSENGATCAAGGCHSPSNNTVISTLISSSPGLAAGYTPGATYSITITVNGSGNKGFQFSPQSASGATMGTLVAPANLQIQQSKYITHRNASSANPAAWTFQWIAPPTGSGTVGFYTAAVGGRNVNLYRQTLSIPEITATVATVTTQAASMIMPHSASSGGNVVTDGGTAVTARGVAYGTSSNPTTSGPSTSNGTGTGAFVSNLTGLSSGTAYFARAYATNSIGTAYGAGITFTTPTGSSVVAVKPSCPFRCWPNPTSSLVAIDWSDSDANPSTLEIVAHNGQIVHRITSLDQQSHHSVSIDFSSLGLSFGSYHLRLLDQGKVIGRERMVYIR